MYTLLLLLHIIDATLITTLVLVQQGKGASMGASFGGRASQTIFGSRGSNSFLLKITVGCGIVFFATSIGLNYIAAREHKNNNASSAIPTTLLADFAKRDAT